MTKPALHSTGSSSIETSTKIGVTKPTTTTNKRCKSVSKLVRQPTKNTTNGQISTIGPVQTVDKRKRIAANARERKRMHLLNNAYDKLRKRLVDAENKSKYDVLVQAKEYIQALTRICENFDKEHPTECPPVELVRDTWRESESFASEQSQCQPATPSFPEVSKVPISSPHPSRATKTEFELSPLTSSLMSPSSDSCFSPMSQPDSVISTCSRQSKVVDLSNNVPDNKYYYSNQTNTTFQLISEQQQMPRMSSTYFSPKTTSNLLPHTILKQGFVPALDSYLVPGSHRHREPVLESTQDIYHQYYQTFHHIQRAI